MEEVEEVEAGEGGGVSSYVCVCVHVWEDVGPLSL